MSEVEYRVSLNIDTHHFVHLVNILRFHLSGCYETFLGLAVVRVLRVVIELGTIDVDRLEGIGFAHPIAGAFEEIMSVAGRVRVNTENIAQLKMAGK
jgi:hypothetical protein